jgi:ABC-2 type transport system permease protein
MTQFSLRRFLAVTKKEFLHMKRDKATYAMILAVPLMQTALFGLAVNASPKHLPVIFVVKQSTLFSQRLMSAMENSLFFSVKGIVKSKQEADKWLRTFKTSFVVYLPDHLESDLIKEIKPQILLEADATDPSAIGAAKSAFPIIVNNTIREIYGRGVVDKLVMSPNDIVDVNIHSVYNPTENSHYGVIPGLLGVILTMSMSLITAMAIAREKDNGTMETLLSTPIKPIEVLLGKLVAYIVVGYAQMILIMSIAIFGFQIPISGSLLLFSIVTLPFIIANLAIGLLLSAIAKTQVQASQMAMFFFLPSMMLSGFAFSYRGMPIWAQRFAEILPLTHYLRVLRGILLKGNGIVEVYPEIIGIMCFFVVALFLGVLKYKKTL